MSRQAPATAPTVRVTVIREWQPGGEVRRIQKNDLLFPNHRFRLCDPPHPQPVSGYLSRTSGTARAEGRICGLDNERDGHMNRKLMLLGTQIDDLAYVADRVSRIIGLELYEMSDEVYGDHFSSSYLNMIERFGKFRREDGAEVSPDLVVIPQRNSRYGQMNFYGMQNYASGVLLSCITEMEPLVEKLLADAELGLEIVDTDPKRNAL